MTVMNTTTDPATSPAAHNGQLNKPDRLNLVGVWEALEHVNEKLEQAKPRMQQGEDTPALKVGMAIVAGCITPLICLAMSTLTGTIASMDGNMRWFGIMPGLVLVAMLIVSTPHITEAKKEIGWEPWQAWSFAIGLDAAIVVCELADVWCHGGLSSIWWLPKVLILGAVLYSAALNSFVNLLHTGWSKVTDSRDN